MNSLTVPVITGPSGIGKTAVATALARLAPIEIVSADSRQIYCGLEAGTAKPTAAERAGVRYHGLDLVGPGERYSAGRFAADAARWIAEICGRGRLPVVVGGTGFYLRALFEGLFDEPPLDPARRERLRKALGRLPSGEVARWARRLDSGFTGGGLQRAARATEVALLTGRPLTVLRRDPPAGSDRLKPWYALLTLPREALAARIAARTRAMLAAGLVEEVRGLIAAGVPPDAPGLSAVGYREAVAVLEGRLDGAALGDRIAASTRRYAKRQETWFHHQLPPGVATFDASKEPNALAREVLAAYRAATAH